MEKMNGKVLSALGLALLAVLIGVLATQSPTKESIETDSTGTGSTVEANTGITIEEGTLTGETIETIVETIVEEAIEEVDVETNTGSTLN